MTVCVTVPRSSLEQCARPIFHIDLWTSADAGARPLAKHVCLEHCKVRARCEQICPPLEGAVVAGVAYSMGSHPEPIDLAPSAALCPLCHSNVRPWTPPVEVPRAPGKVGPACGTRPGWAQHRRRKEEPCRPCDEANRAYHRESRARRRELARQAAA